MTRISDRHYQEDNSNATVGDPTLSTADHAALLREAQCEVGREMGKAIMASARWVGHQGTKFLHAIADLTRPPTAAT